MDSSNPVSKKSSVLSQVISYFTSYSTTAEAEERSFKPHIKENNSEMESFETKGSECAYLSKKAQMLHSAHKMNDKQNEWFKNTSETPPLQFSPSHQESFPTYSKQKQFKPTEPEVPTSQFALNINSNCYENLQVHQTPHNPYSPYLEEEFHPSEFQYFQFERETQLPQPSFLPFGNLYENIIDFVETTIVQYVCQRTNPSPFRLAAEILARSKLNPNANEFTPMVKNPAVIETEGKIEEKNDSEHLGEYIEVDNTKLVDMKENQEIEETMINMENEIQQGCVEKGEPLDEDPNCSKLVQCSASDNSLCDLKLTCDGDNSGNDCFNDDSDDDCFSDDYDDDSDWDSEEQSTGQCVEFDPSEFEDLFTSPLLVTNLRICQTKSSNPGLKICPVTKSSSSAKHVLNPPIRTISEINSQFFDQDQIISSCCKDSKKIVKFCDGVDVIDEPEDLAEDLQNARISDFPARQADRERMERLLAPIMTKMHREKMFKKIYGDT
eukprot:TRINITY_DN4093_c0_g1_i2.p1 TRINITY_DN4093_c0_g1~~TRINITY_DN4093_c0_g1_i2.p1  ORF type:complete len:496 (-),score=118.46 TRINITY_DN4093_c0_g1_i2:67-1554(-)